MNEQNHYYQAQQGMSLSPSDVYFILFRHKWKIILLSILGVVVSAGIYLVIPPTFRSEARLFIRYVEERTAPISMGSETQTRSPDSRGDTIINSELQILSSMDLALKVAKEVGPEKILQDATKRHFEEDAAKVISASLGKQVPKNSSIISLSFEHENRSIVRPVLDELIKVYLEKHQSIHHSSSTVDEFTLQQKDQYRNRLARTEQELKRAHEKAGITSLPEAKKDQSEKIAQIRQALFDAQAELAARQGAIKATSENLLKITNDNQDETKDLVKIPDPGIIQAYANLNARIDLLRRKEEGMLSQYTGESVLVKGVREQIRELENKKLQMEAENPMLAMAESAVPLQPGRQPQGSISVQAESIQAAALEAKISVLNEQLKLVLAEANRVKEVEIEIQELMRRKELEEEHYRYFSESSEKAKINEAFGAGGVRNIGIVQSPSATRKVQDKTLKFMAGAALGGVAFGLAWAFLLELFLDRSIKRPVDIERRIGVPLFLSIPNAKQRSFRKLAKSKNKKHLRLIAASKAKASKSKENYKPKSPTLIAAAKSNPNDYGTEAGNEAKETHLVAFDETQELKPYYEALRDRMIGYFESRNLTHSPKLIGLTGLGNSPGVTTVASGLAKCLSETGEGNVLLVDMTLGQESAQQYYKGSEICDLDQALEARKNAKQEENLYVVAEGTNGYKVPSILPNRFNNIVPKLKASDFDYIIFDMPEVSPISPTPRLSGFMDAMLMVIESEKTSSDVVEKATKLLQESNAHVGAVLNKTKSYVPKMLQQDFVGHS